jgi:hypothetical protein
MTRYADQKTGTSLAARQPENAFTDVYLFAARCSATTCVATNVGGPSPKNPTIPQPARYTWDGAEWVEVVSWQWDCLTRDGGPVEWNPARSQVTYLPQPDGSLKGIWHTDIYSGACQGTVEMPVAAAAV